MTSLQPEQPTQFPVFMSGKTGGGKKQIAVSGQTSEIRLESLPAMLCAVICLSSALIG